MDDSAAPINWSIAKADEAVENFDWRSGGL